MSEKGERAKELFKEGYNCAQSVFGAFAEELGLDFDLAVKIASGFGGGMGRMRNVCGTVTGMFMAADMLYGYSDPSANADKAQLYSIIQQLAAEFTKANGSIVCKELLGLQNGTFSPVPEARTSEYYKKRPCAELCENAADILDAFIKEHGEINK